jgi:hypothetical protein
VRRTIVGPDGRLRSMRTGRPLQTRERFRWRFWEYPPGTKRHDLWCNECGFGASGTVDPLAPADEHMKAAALHECPPVMFEWDAWRRLAWHCGMDPETADVGRSLIREHSQHGWNIGIDCEGMLASGVKSPRTSRRRWLRLLEEHNGKGIT